MSHEVILDGPKNLFLSAQAIATVLDCLAEGRFRIVNPVIEEIMRQLKEQEPKKGD